MWKKFSLDLEYNIVSNPYLETGVLSEDKSTVIITPINLALAKNFTTMLSYANEWEFFSMSVSGMMFIPNYRVPYMDGYYDNNVVSYNFKISPGFKLAKTTNVSVRYSYASRTADLMSIYEPSHDLSIDFSQFLFKRRVQIVASASNLLNRNDSPWRDKIGYYEAYNDSTDKDMRRLKIYLRYIFNNFESKYKGYKELEPNRRVN